MLFIHILGGFLHGNDIDRPAVRYWSKSMITLRNRDIFYTSESFMQKYIYQIGSYLVLICEIWRFVILNNHCIDNIIW